ncbi:MAG: membrane protein insertion efficiency factor YidD [Candidatus Omnitrophica bacterium]|nr:membrane protein insertion efficiency factor YidD [Candidatus Omnitrophota bacterium]
MLLIRVISKKISQAALWAIDLYRNYLSVLMLPRCRFYPTCSAYAKEAIIKKGLLRGVLLSTKRLLRCHPFSQADSYDPVK